MPELSVIKSFFRLPHVLSCETNATLHAPFTGAPPSSLPYPMKHHILLAATTLFAAQANELIEQSPHALVLGDASLAGHGHLTALFSADPVQARNASRSLLSIQVIEGSPKSVAAKLEKLAEENPYVRPLRVLGCVTAIDAKQETQPVADEEPATPATAKKAAKKAAKNATDRPSHGDFERSVIAIVGTFQP